MFEYAANQVRVKFINEMNGIKKWKCTGFKETKILMQKLDTGEDKTDFFFKNQLGNFLDLLRSSIINHQNLMHDFLDMLSPTKG